MTSRDDYMSFCEHDDNLSFVDSFAGGVFGGEAHDDKEGLEGLLSRSGLSLTILHQLTKNYQLLS